MNYENITKEDLYAVINDLDDTGRYNICIENIISQDPEILVVENTSISSDIESQDDNIYFDKTKKVLEIITKTIENIHLDCELRDISTTHGKLASITIQKPELSAKSIVINSGTIKFKSLCNNDLLLSLHIAECIFREILYYDQGFIDVNKLDDLIDEFYNLYFHKLNNKYEKHNYM